MLVELITCRRCAQEKPAHRDNPHLCDECVKAENNRVSYFRRNNADWMEIAKEADLQLWERQPAETDHEYHVWLAYRDAYPGKRPSYRDAAIQVGTSVNAVKKIAARWNFPMRLQAWAKYVDEITLAERTKQIKEMNKAHVDMAAALRDKLKKAIDNIDPYSLTPKEISQMLKIATEIERKAQLHEVPQTPVAAIDDTSPDLKKVSVKSSDLGEIVNILASAGVLNNFGVRQTVTTEVVVRDEE